MLSKQEKKIHWKNTIKQRNCIFNVQLSCTLNMNGFKSFHNFSAMTFKSLPEVPFKFLFSK